MSERGFSTLASACLILAAALRAVCTGGEAGELDKLRAAAEEACFQAAKKCLHEYLVALNRDVEGKDRDLDPFSPEHFLSQGKPNMGAKALPEPKEGVATRDVKIEGVTFAAPIPQDMEPSSPTRSGTMAIFRKDGFSICLSRSALSVTEVEPPKEIKEKLAKSPGGLDAEGVKKEFARLRAMSEFDLLVAIKTCDVKAFDSGVPFPRRMAALFLFGMKTVFGCGRSTWQYYEGKHLRCFISLQPEYISEVTNTVTGEKRREKREHYIYAEFAFREHNAVFDLRLLGSKASDGPAMVEGAATFLANCKLKSVEKAGTGPGE
ncbi:MAG: hypothetical protein FJ290_18675 [Planctomycetes bacterium]|nr:hypothetical protein [Planctomycetota bacterium]